MLKENELSFWKQEFFREKITSHPNHPLTQEFNRIIARDNNDDELIEECAQILKNDPNWKEKSGRLAEEQVVKIVQKAQIKNLYIEHAPLSLDMPSGSSHVDMVMVLPSGKYLAVQFFESRSHMDKDKIGKLANKYNRSLEHGIAPLKRFRNEVIFNGQPMPIAVAMVDQAILREDNPDRISRKFLESARLGIDPSFRNLQLKQAAKPLLSASQVQILSTYSQELAQLERLLPR